MAHHLRMLSRLSAGQEAAPTAAVMDSRTLQSTPESGARARYDGAKRRKGSKVHTAVATLGQLLMLQITAADEQDRSEVERLAQAVQQITGDNVDVAFVDQGYRGQDTVDQATRPGIDLLVVKHTHAKKGFILLPRRWVVERSFGWVARICRLARDYERLSETLAGLHYVAFVCLMLTKAVSLVASGS